MTPTIRPGRPADPADLLRAQEREQLLRTELPTVRTAAVAWRNGLTGLLAALVGFSLIKGRSDVSTLAPGWAAMVGILLLLALAAGAGGAVALLRAAHGRPAAIAQHTLPVRSVVEHLEALVSAKALKYGIVMTLSCAALLAAAVGATWYGPTRTATPGPPTCGIQSTTHNTMSALPLLNTSP